MVTQILEYLHDTYVYISPLFQDKIPIIHLWSFTCSDVASSLELAKGVIVGIWLSNSGAEHYGCSLPVRKQPSSVGGFNKTIPSPSDLRRDLLSFQPHTIASLEILLVEHVFTDKGGIVPQFLPFLRILRISNILLFQFTFNILI